MAGQNPAIFDMNVFIFTEISFCHNILRNERRSMKTIATNSDNDVYLDALGNLALVSDIDALALVIKQRIQTVLGECQLATNVGVDYFGSVFNQPPDVFLFRKQIVNNVEAINGVNSVVNFAMRIEDSTLKYEMNVSTVYGETTITG